ncbi:TlpA family protein disulfide reductase [Gelidibacter maritimus]|uniref:TlpA family protein disulfide reductase n=1 Tax=Gelidibacter maritimus TaxID=2761487 RepID=A0A7W2M3I4_9FLAO|nr:TlpA disulfide reductase family protein [Gelidibacter maritimus]MBA6152048.1 TlpA family protein disulfide reductase [Gelidibacter maritimus]
MAHKVSIINLIALIGMLLLLTASCKKSRFQDGLNKNTDIILNINMGQHGSSRSVSVFFKDSSYRVSLDSQGIAKLNISGVSGSGYASIYGPREIRSTYLEPGKELSLYRDENGEYSFTGDMAKINNYLNNYIPRLNVDYKMQEEKFLNQWGKLSGLLKMHFDTLSLPDNFIKIEKRRMDFIVNNMLLDYSLYYSRYHGIDHSPSDDYYNTLVEKMQEDSTLSELFEYRQSFKKWVQMLANRNSLDNKPISKLRSQLTYVDDNIEGARLAEYLTHSFIFYYVRDNGIAGIDEMLPFYNLKVEDRSKISEFQKMYNEYSKLEKGNPAPDFKFTSIDGNSFQLSDFYGKYLYIDVWATWCVPCLKEYPVLKKLEEQFEGRKINFVSVSIDENMNDWREKVEKENMKGFVLHIGNDTTFRKNYMIDLIPRFILIDPQGNIIDSKMTRPSNLKTSQSLSKLPGI